MMQKDKKDVGCKIQQDRGVAPYQTPKAELGQALASLTKQGLLLCKMADS